MSSRGTLIAGLLAAGMGIFPILIGLGVVPVDERSVHAPMWIAIAAGLMFLLAGISIAVGALQGASPSGELPENTGWWLRLFYYLLGLVVAGLLASIGSWVAFGRGDRSFGGTGMFLLSREANAVAGRIIFGFGAVLTWLCVLGLVVSGARKLFSKPAGETERDTAR
jgi:hypothetical protein